MKKILILTFLIGGLADALAQGTLQFSVHPTGADEVPPNSSLNTAAPGTFTLNGTTLTYDFGIVIGNGWPLPTDATVNGPANSGSTAPVLFDLGAPSPFTGINPPIGGYWQGSINNLTDTQINELSAGLWYVNVFTDSSYPGGEYRGQITPVPEPSALVLLGSGIGSLGFWPRRKKR